MKKGTVMIVKSGDIEIEFSEYSAIKLRDALNERFPKDTITTLFYPEPEVHLPIVIDPKILEILIPWLKCHEYDIALGVNDFGELAPIFEAFFMAQPEGKK